MELWKESEIENGVCQYRRIGPLRLWIQHENKEWLLAYDRLVKKEDEEETSDEDNKPEDLEFNRYFVKDKSNKFKLLPYPPERDVVIKPESKIRIIPEGTMTFFAVIPLVFKFSIGKDFKQIIDEIPTQELSNTWFGEPVNGFLCYSIKTALMQNIKNRAFDINSIICPITVKNSSSSDLEFTRLCVRTKHLTVFVGEMNLWSNRVNVLYRGSGQESSIKYEDKAPDLERPLKKLTEPRVKPGNNFSIKSFDTFRFLAGGQ